MYSYSFQKCIIGIANFKILRHQEITGERCSAGPGRCGVRAGDAGGGVGGVRGRAGAGPPRPGHVARPVRPRRSAGAHCAARHPHSTQYNLYLHRAISYNLKTQEWSLHTFIFNNHIWCGAGVFKQNFFTYQWVSDGKMIVEIQEVCFSESLEAVEGRGVVYRIVIRWYRRAPLLLVMDFYDPKYVDRTLHRTQRSFRAIAKLSPHYDNRLNRYSSEFVGKLIW